MVRDCGLVHGEREIVPASPSSIRPGVVGEGRRVIANVERVANLFVTKTVYAMLLAIAIGIVR